MKAETAASIGILAVIGVGAYFLYNKFKDFKMPTLPTAEEIAAALDPKGPPSNSIGGCTPEDEKAGRCTSNTEWGGPANLEPQFRGGLPRDVSPIPNWGVPSLRPDSLTIVTGRTRTGGVDVEYRKRVLSSPPNVRVALPSGRTTTLGGFERRVSAETAARLAERGWYQT